MEKTYDSPELEIRKVVAFETISASDNEDNELNVNNYWGNW